MTVRRVFLALVVPLFLLLAGVNGALLYVWEQAEARRGLQNQAIAAAVTVAAFVDSGQGAADSVVAARLSRAAPHVTGLVDLHLIDAEGRAVRVVGAGPETALGRLARPDAPLALPIAADPPGGRVAIGLAPAAGGRFVVARIDAEPLFARAAALRGVLVVLVFGAGALGFILAWLVARRIARELAGAHALVAAAGQGADDGEASAFRIRETRDLAAAVRLMRASVAGRLARGRHELARRERVRTETSAAAAWRETALPPLSATAVGVEVCVRRLGATPAGSFHALCVRDGRAALVLGECEAARPSDALARALAARRFCERRLLEGPPEDRLAEAARAFAIRRLAWTDWSDGAQPDIGVLALLDGEAGERAAAYRRRAEGLAPDAVIDDLETLLDTNGVVAVLRPAP